MRQRTHSMMLIGLGAIMAVAGISPLGSRYAQAQSVGGCRTFQQTGYRVCGRFLDYWAKHGGLAQNGYPISEPFVELSQTDGKTYVVQYFERAVFESHPEFAPPNDVLLSLLGVLAYKEKYPSGAPGQVPATDPGSAQFYPTRYRVRGWFIVYWNNNGQLAQFGYPISEEFQEVSPLDGKIYIVQYFERAVFEYHPEYDEGHRVLLSQLGTFRARERYLYGFLHAGEVLPYENRTSPVELLGSYYNAINRREYRRAYSYFEPRSNVPPYERFAAGYNDTNSVIFMPGDYTTGDAMGTTYAFVPAVIIATHSDGTDHTFYGCYVLRRSNNSIDSIPPSGFWYIDNSNVGSNINTSIKPAPAKTATSRLLAQGCKQ